MSQPTKVLKLAVCLFPDVCTLDFQGPMELFGFLSPSVLSNPAIDYIKDPKYAFQATYIAPTLDPIEPMTGPQILPSRTYDSVGSDEQFDMLLIPGGFGARPDATPQSLISFLKRQAPGATYVLSVCTGSWVLAQAGLLGGKRATTNKSAFKVIKEATHDQNIEWVAKARWVVDGKFWTSSGVTAGADMANAFLEYLLGEEVTTIIRGVTELSVHKEGDDEFAAFHGLV